MKKLLTAVIVLILILGGLIFIRFILGGPEDSWICQNGEWVKHGNPKAEKPTTACEKTYELYWGEGCPHCKNVDDFLNTWEKSSEVKIEKLEVQKNKENSDKMIKRANECKLDTSKGLSVPFLYTPDEKCIVGDTPIIDHFKSL